MEIEMSDTTEGGGRRPGDGGRTFARTETRKLIHYARGYAPQVAGGASQPPGDGTLGFGSGDSGDSDALDYSVFLRELWRRKWLFIVIAALALSVATTIIAWLPAYHVAHALVVIGEPSVTEPSNPTVNAAVPTPPPDPGAVQTAVEILRSPELAANVIRRLNLEENPEFNPTVANREATGVIARAKEAMSGIKSFIAESFGSQGSPVPQADIDAELSQTVNGFLAHLRVSVKDNSRMIDVAFESLDARLAMRVANMIVDQYVEKHLELRAQIAQRTSGWLSDRIGQLQAEVEKAERAVEQFRSENGLYSTPGGSPLLLKQMTDVSAELASARSARAAIEAQLRQNRASLEISGRNSTIGDIVDSPLMKTLRDEEAKIQQQLAEASMTYSARHPTITGLKERLRNIQAAMRREGQRSVASLESDLQIARMKEQELSDRLNGLETDVARMNSADVTLRALERKAEADRRLLDDFVARYKTTSQNTDTSSLTPNAHIASYAQLPVRSEQPKKGLLLLVAGIGSLIGAFLVVHFVEKSDRSLHGLEEAEKDLKIAGLGMLPISEAARLSATEAARYGSAYREALKDIYLNLFGKRDVPQVAVITSATPGDGKTTLALSLAAMAAQNGRGVMLLDADFWKKGVSTAMDIRSGMGLAEVLEGKASLTEATISDVVSGADVMSSGKFSRGSLLTWSDDLRQLLVTLRNRYDLVIIDSPPVLSASESMLLTKHADATVMAVRWGKTPRDAVALTTKKLRDAGALLAGVVLTMVSERQHAQYGYKEATYFSPEFQAYQSAPTGAITLSSAAEDSREYTSPDEDPGNKRAATRHALLVVDMQENHGASSVWSLLPKMTRDLLVKTINDVSDLAVKSGMTVIYAHEEAGHFNTTPLSHLRAKGIAGDYPVTIRPDTNFKMVSKLRFPKQYPDAFSNSQLDGFLREKAIDHLFVVGMDGMTSIRQTACSALNQGYRVTLIEDGIFTTFENRWQQQLKSFESAAAFAITSEEFAEFCQRLHNGSAPEPASHASL